MDAGGIHGVMGCPEVATVALVGVVVLDVETATLEEEVGIDAEHGIIANLHAFVGVLGGELADDGGIVGGIVLGEVLHVGTQFAVEHLGDKEGKIKVMVGGEFGQGQDVLFGGGLVGDVVVEMEGSELEVLLETCADNLDVIVVLTCYDVVGDGGDVAFFVVEGCSVVGKIGVVFEVLHRETQTCSCLGEDDVGTKSCLCGASHLIVPPGVGGMVMVEVEIGIFATEKCMEHHLSGIAQQRHIEFSPTRQTHISGIVASYHEFDVCVVVNPCALCTDHLTTYKHVVLVVFDGREACMEGTRNGVGHGVGAMEESHVCVQSSYGILIKAFIEGDTDKISDFQHLVPVVHGIAWQELIGMESVVRHLCLIGTPIALEREGVEEAGDRHEDIVEVGGVAFGTGEADVVAMVEPDDVVLLLHEVVREVGGYIVGSVPLCHSFGIGDVLVVLDTAVLTQFHVVVGVVEMEVVAVAGVGTEACAAHEGGGLVVVIARSVHVVEDASEVDALTCVVGVEGTEMVVATLLRTTPVVGEVHVRRLGVVVAEIAWCDEKLVEGMGKDELAPDGTVHIYTRKTRRTDVSQRIVFANQTFGQVAILEMMVEGIDIDVGRVSVVRVNGPGAYIGRYDFLCCLLLGVERIAFQHAVAQVRTCVAFQFVDDALGKQRLAPKEAQEQTNEETFASDH